MRFSHIALLLASPLLLTAFAASADDYIITLKDQQFTPAALVLPAGQKVQVTIKNEDKTQAEFESEELGREKVVAANSEIKIWLGPLKAGTYLYVNDFHEETKGSIVVK